LAVVVLLLLLAARPAAAHEFWLQPGRYAAARGDTVAVSAYVGNGLQGERRAYDPARVAHLALHTGGAARDLAAAGTPGGAFARFVAPDDSGAVVAYLSNLASIELPADRFDAYLREEGLDGPLAARAANPDRGGVGRERYRRCAKTWIAPEGAATGGRGRQRLLRAVGLPLEIVPLADPAASRRLRVEVRFQGSPLAGALVRAWRGELAADGRALDPGGRQTAGASDQGRTDARGRVELHIDAPGEWLLGTVHMVPCPDSTIADWESTWASLTFGVMSR
jgi:hypothetical protein